jgi:hypothetical protein
MGDIREHDFDGSGCATPANVGYLCPELQGTFEENLMDYGGWPRRDDAIYSR